jgi:hypothetical protein
MVTRCDGPWATWRQPAFAGPCTERRGAGLVDGATYEVVDTMPSDRIPAGGEVVADDAGKLMVFVPGAAGATLGEILDETAAQKARIDANVAVALLARVVDAALALDDHARRRAALAADQVLVSFDGALLLRGHLPWWGSRRAPEVEPGFVISSNAGETAVLLGVLAAELFTSRRGRPRSLSLPAIPRAIRADARDLLVRLLEGPVAPDVEENWEHVDVPRDDELRARLARLTLRVSHVDDADLAGLVRGLFPERWADEKRARDLVDGLVAGYAP